MNLRGDRQNLRRDQHNRGENEEMGEEPLQRASPCPLWQRQLSFTSKMRISMNMLGAKVLGEKAASTLPPLFLSTICRRAEEGLDPI